MCKEKEGEDVGMERRDDLGDQSHIKEVHNTWWKLDVRIPNGSCSDAAVHFCYNILYSNTTSTTDNNKSRL